MKEVLVERRASRPPRYAAFGAGDEAAALAFLETLPGLYVVKTDGLAAGKGVVVTESLAEARDAVRAYLSGDGVRRRGPHVRDRRGPAPGPSSRCSCCATARDAQSRSPPRRTTSARSTATPGPNTGGMGAYSPVPFVGRRRSSTR